MKSCCGCNLEQRDPDNEMSGWFWRPCDWHKKVLDAAVVHQSVMVYSGDDIGYGIQRKPREGFIPQ